VELGDSNPDLRAAKAWRPLARCEHHMIDVHMQRQKRLDCTPAHTWGTRLRLSLRSTPRSTKRTNALVKAILEPCGAAWSYLKIASRLNLEAESRRRQPATTRPACTMSVIVTVCRHAAREFAKAIWTKLSSSTLSARHSNESPTAWTAMRRPCGKRCLRRKCQCAGSGNGAHCEPYDLEAKGNGRSVNQGRSQFSGRPHPSCRNDQYPV
jgi:hypothetical protein